LQGATKHENRQPHSIGHRHRVRAGLQSSLVGISHECDFPGVEGLPILTRSSIDSTRPPAQIDADVNAAVASGESLYLTNRELLRELAPDIVLTQTICDVCAVNSQTAARDLPAGAQLVNLSATSIAGLWDDLRAVADVSSTNAEPLIDEFKRDWNE
jgi:iron complex transport system substrate-binding protein